jgi:Polyketide cyclase / dehydrase and lipid transport
VAAGFVSVSRHIEASPERLFALVADSANHPLIDGSGMVREPAPAARLSRTGDVFVMNMHHDEFGDYQMRNEVLEYEAGRRLVWEPVRVTTSPEELEAMGGPARYRWGYEFSPERPRCHPGHRDVRLHPFPDDLRNATQEGEGWRDAMTASLVRLELLAKATGQPGQ